MRESFNSQLLVAVAGLNNADAEITAPPDLAIPNLLGQITFGRIRPAAVAAAPSQHVYASVLFPSASFCAEQWWTRKIPYAESDSGIQLHSTDDLMFGVIEVEERAIGAEGVPSSLQDAAELAYKKLFSLLENRGYGYLWRVWNYMGDINGVTHGVERYQQFNAGRQKGFASSDRSLIGNVPVACAIGVQSNVLSLGFLAARSPATAIENPRQISAYHYPAKYGSRSPTFSRASLAKLTHQELFLLSGTASILGHQSVHLGSAQLQTIETLANIDALLEQANLISPAHHAYSLKDLSLRIYIRHKNDFDTIKKVMTDRLGARHQATYVEAAICRSDLLVEIEGIASRAI